MRRRSTVAGVTSLVVVAVLASSLTGAVVRRGRKKAAPPVGKDIQQIAPAAQVYTGPRPLVAGAPKEAPNLHEVVASRLTKARLGAPPYRLQQFRWLNDPNFRLDGWYAEVKAVESAAGGHIVTVAVIPLVTTTLGASTTVMGGVREQYFVTDSGAQYLRSLDGLGSGEPSIITD